ncbi:cysteine desulfurase family protein [Thermoactinomyces sp. CICC 10521]|jgi:cysteine desulfurase|uniref:cysteine desulfurase family protein n=1 Tax=Thermoactinomyces sp. CICC 10521 TaxID=2767426 RepID=UPI0018DBFB2C|nr:cysteine desulfurase family protein [Thermoactinomyces sp. CICC 10521]MBH8608229.1 cysteine desulfurase [Thermoactinomyces sp. CICC 10521]
MIYLDNSATTKISSEVLKAMLPYLQEEYGNPSSKFYSLAENSRKAVECARQQVATFLDCEPEELIFTSGSTESNNMILKGVVETYGHLGKKLLTTQSEHSSVMETCKYLETKGVKVIYLRVDRYGRIDINELEEMIQNERPLLVSVIWGNNEVGSLNDIDAISEICLRNNVFLHTDATQVCGKIPISLKKLPGITFLSMSAHKIHGPKGIGVCFIKNEAPNIRRKLVPLIHGTQENGYRGGTLAVHNIVGLGKAAQLANQKLEEHHKKLKMLEKTLESILKETFGDRIQFFHDSERKIPGILSVRFVGKNNEVLLKKLSPYLAMSTGSACSSGKPSHVLQAMGKSFEEIRQTVRISLSPENTLEELEFFRKLA